MAITEVRPPTVGTQSAPPAKVKARKRSVGLFSGVSGLLIVGMLAITVLPLLAVMVQAFFVDGSFSFDVIRETLAMPELGTVMFNTVIAVVATGIVSILIGGVLAWLQERTDAKMGFFGELAPLIPFLLAPIAGAVAWVLLLSPGSGYLNAIFRWMAGFVGLEMTDGPLNIYSWFGLIFVYVIYQVPYAFLLISTGLRNMDSSIEEQARVCGTPTHMVLLRITLPALLPSVAGASLLIAWSTLALYSVPAVIGTGSDIKVLTVLLVEQIIGQTPPRQDLALGLSLLMILIIAAVWWVQSAIARRGRHATIGGKARAAAPVNLGKWRWVARAGMVGYAAVTTGLPILALVLVSLTGYWRPQFSFSDFSFDAISRALDGSSGSGQAISNSLVIGISGATIGVIIAAILALYLSRLRPVVSRVLDGALKLPATLSHVVIAVGFILVFAGPPFLLGGTIAILLLAYLAMYYPQGAVSADNAVAQIGKELPEASHVAGAGQVKTFTRIYMPLMVPGMIAGWGLLFVRMVGDLTASAILAGPRNIVVGKQIYEIYVGGSYGQLAALATIVTFLTSVVILLTTVISKRGSRWSTRTAGKRAKTSKGLHS